MRHHKLYVGPESCEIFCISGQLSRQRPHNFHSSLDFFFRVENVTLVGIFNFEGLFLFDCHFRPFSTENHGLRGKTLIFPPNFRPKSLQNKMKRFGSHQPSNLWPLPTLHLCPDNWPDCQVTASLFMEEPNKNGADTARITDWPPIASDWPWGLTVQPHL